MTADVLPVCFYCREVPERGLYDGFRLHGTFYCHRCEEQFIKTRPETPEYHNLVRSIRTALFSAMPCCMG